MKQPFFFLLILIVSVFVSCSSENGSSDEVNNGLEIIKIDLSEAREGKLSEFFEPEIKYMWLKDDSEDAQLGAGLQKIIFHEDKILTLDVFGCKCLKIFDSNGNYLSKIRAYGEGPEKYLDLDNFIVVNKEVLLLGVYPAKLMWFDLEGDFLREEKLPKGIKAGVFLESTDRYHFFSEHYTTEDYLVSSVSSDFKDSVHFFPKDSKRYYGDFSGRDNFINNVDEIYFTMAFQDTIFKLEKDDYVPKLILDFGEYGQDIEEYRRKMDELEAMERMDFINKKVRLQFIPSFWFVNENYFYSRLSYEGKEFNVFFDRENQKTSVLNWIIKDDIDEGFNPYSIIYRFDQNKVGLKISGRDLNEILEKKKEELGPETFEEYIKGKGKNFAKAAFEAKDSENPVLIIYTPKK